MVEERGIIFGRGCEGEFCFAGGGCVFTQFVVLEV